MIWPFFGLFLLVQSQTGEANRSQTSEILENTDSLHFSKHQLYHNDCTKIGCTGSRKDPVEERVVLPLDSKDPIEERVVLEVKAAEASDLHAPARVCQGGVDSPNCHGEKIRPGTLEMESFLDASANGTAVEGEEEVQDLRIHLLCMVILICSCSVFSCRVSFALMLAGLGVTDQIMQWGSLLQCSRPMHDWLLGTYMCACALRLAYKVATRYFVADSDFPWYLRRSKKWGPLPPICLATLILVPVPFISCWSIIGMNWLNDVLENSRDSLASSTGHAHVAAVVACLIFNVLGVLAALVFVFYACIVSRSFAAGGEAINAISDADFVQRWGPPQPILAEDFRSGLGPDEIACLPCDEVLSDYTESHAGNCAICLNKFAKQDRVRRLPNCKHEFHRPCIDQWLLRVSSCPLCLGPVSGGSSCDSSMFHNSIV